MISQDTIQQILSRIDIIDVVGGFVRLKKRGANYIGNCPFHHEKTPSFTVSPTKEIFKCFGCGKSGNTINFLMEHEKYTYPEALRWLANRYNVEIEETQVSDEKRQQLMEADSLYIINSFAQKFFSEALLETEEGQDVGLSYLIERGFRKDIIEKFQIGYNSNSGNAFATAALAAKYSKELLMKSGLCVERDGRLRDNYRGRIIFPIHNQTGKVVGFGARIIKTNDRAPKYINTPENDIYVKSRILYGMFQARTAIDKADECLLVEGYTDVVSLHQAGIENVVASGGTSLTQDQLRLIKRFTPNLTILYDGDSAGIKAALRGLDLALEEGLNVKLALIPDNEDPDSYVHKLGAEKFTEFIGKNKTDFILFELHTLMKEAGDDSQKKAQVVNKISDSISRLSRPQDFTVKQDYIRKVSQLMQIDENGLNDLVNKNIRDRYTAQFKKDGSANNAERQNFQTSLPSDISGSEPEQPASSLLRSHEEESESAVIRCLLEFGTKEWEEGRTVAKFLFDEMEQDGLEQMLENKTLQKIFTIYQRQYLNGTPIEIKNLLYTDDEEISSKIVKMMEAKEEVSPNWKKFYSGKIETREDLYRDEVLSTLTYLKVRKVKKLIADNDVFLKEAKTNEDMVVALQTQQVLKDLEKSLLHRAGTVIFK